MLKRLALGTGLPHPMAQPALHDPLGDHSPSPERDRETGTSTGLGMLREGVTWLSHEGRDSRNKESQLCQMLLSLLIR